MSHAYKVCILVRLDRNKLHLAVCLRVDYHRYKVISLVGLGGARVSRYILVVNVEITLYVPVVSLTGALGLITGIGVAVIDNTLGRVYKVT